MSVALATQNPEAFARHADERPLPKIGHIVLYYYRPGQIFNRMNHGPALVMNRDPVNNLLTLLVPRGLDDWLWLDAVPRRVENDQGWEFVDDGPSQVAPLGLAAAAIAQAPGVADADAPTAASVEKRLEDFMDESARVLLGSATKFPDVPLFDQVAALEKRLAAAEKALAGKKATRAKR